MQAFLATNFMGVFAFGKSGKLVAYALFPRDPEGIAKRLQESGTALIEEERNILRTLSRQGYKEVFLDRRVSFPGISCIYEPENLGKKTLQENFRTLALELKWVSSQAELNKIMAEVNVLLTKEKLKIPKKDRIIMQVIGVVDELDRTLNTFTERLREWYGLHFPEMVRAVPSHDKFVELIAKFGSRDNIDDKKVKIQPESSSGMPFSREDIMAVQGFSYHLSGLYKSREDLIKYLDSICGDAIPNLSALAGSTLAARLLSLAGGLEKLARMPSSTIQLIGAEKALFRHLKGGGKSPKYGVIYQHPYIQNAPREKRGKIARLLAAKLMLAARFDFYSGRNKSQELKSNLEKQIRNATGRG